MEELTPGEELPQISPEQQSRSNEGNDCNNHVTKQEDNGCNDCGNTETRTSTMMKGNVGHGCNTKTQIATTIEGNAGNECNMCNNTSCNHTISNNTSNNQTINNIPDNAQPELKSESLIAPQQPSKSPSNDNSQPVTAPKDNQQASSDSSQPVTAAKDNQQPSSDRSQPVTAAKDNQQASDNCSQSVTEPKVNQQPSSGSSEPVTAAEFNQQASSGSSESVTAPNVKKQASYDRSQPVTEPKVNQQPSSGSSESVTAPNVKKQASNNCSQPVTAAKFNQQASSGSSESVTAPNVKKQASYDNSQPVTAPNVKKQASYDSSQPVTAPNVKQPDSSGSCQPVTAPKVNQQASSGSSQSVTAPKVDQQASMSTSNDSSNTVTVNRVKCESNRGKSGEKCEVVEEVVLPEKAPTTTVKLRKLGGLRANNLRKLIKRRSHKWEDSDGDNTSQGSGDRTSMDGDQDRDSTYGSQEDISALSHSDRSSDSGAVRSSDSSLIRQRLTFSSNSDSLSSISSKESSCDEKDPGAILSRQLSRKNSRANKNPITDHENLRLFLLFISTILGWLLKLLLLLWHHISSFFTDGEDEQDETSQNTENMVTEGEERKISIVHPIRKMDYCKEQGKEKVYYICNELTMTEEAYVERLEILVMAKERSSKIVGAAVARQMFKDIEVIYSFHNDNLLPELKNRMAKWDDHRKIGDVMRKLTPFLKLYTEYVKDFQRASALVDTWEGKSSTFAAMIRDIRDNQAERHGKLKVQAHMMEPIQRVPRYELLLRDYLKRLPDDAVDRTDTEQALEQVAKAASHFEDMMKRDSRIARLIEVRERLDSSYVNIVIPNRELIAERKHNIVSRSSQKPVEKQVFLFNDLLLVCSRQKIQKKFKVKTAIDLREAEVSRGTNLDIPFTLTLHTSDSQVDIAFSSEEEELEWKQILQNLVDAFTKTLARCSTISIGSTDSHDSGITTHSGYVHVSSDEGRTWKRRWAVVTESGKLKAYKTEQDATPISWIRIEKFTMEMAYLSRKSVAILLEAFGRRYLFKCDEDAEFTTWFNVLQGYEASSSTDPTTNFPPDPEVDSTL